MDLEDKKNTTTDVENLLTDSEDEIPNGWEIKATDDGNVYYIDHNNRSTQWEHPHNGKRKFLAKDLPYGWKKSVDDKGKEIFYDLISKRTTYVDPRMAYSHTGSNKGKKKYDSYSTAMEVMRGQDMTGKTAIVTGGNCGIGFQTVRALALHGCHVVMACRDVTRGKAAAKKIYEEQQNLPSDIDVVECNLASLASIKRFVTSFLENKWPLDILICNAAVMGLPYTTSDDGIEMTFAVNHLGHFYLTKLLTECLCNTPDSRVVVVASESHRLPCLPTSTFSVKDLPLNESNYWSMLAYNQSKLCNVLFTVELSRRLADSGVLCNAVHPGNMVYSNISRYSTFYWLLYLMARPFTKSKEQAAATQIYTATAPEMNGISGYYFNHCCACSPSDYTKDEQLCKELWDYSEHLIKEITERGCYQNQQGNLI